MRDEAATPQRASSVNRHFGSHLTSTTAGAGAAMLMANRALAIAIALVLSPYIVSEVGLAAYGFWAVVSGLTAWTALLDLGVGSSLAPFVAEAHERGARARVRSVISAGLLLLLGVAVGIELGAAVVVTVIPGDATSTWPPGWQVATLASFAALGVSLIASVFTAVPAGLGRWRWYAATPLAAQLATSLAIIAFLETGLGVAGLGLALLAGSLVSLMSGLVSAAALAPHYIRPTLRRTRLTARELLSYSANIQVSNIAQVLNTQTDRIILAFFAPLAWIGQFELGSRAALSLRAIPLAAFAPIIADSARVHVVQGLAGTRAMYLRTFWLVWYLAVLPMIFLSGASFAAIIAWLGTDFVVAAGVGSALVFAYAVNVASGPGTSVARGVGRPQIDRNYSTISLCINVVLTLVLGVLLGPVGVIAATVLAMISSTILLLITVDSWLGTQVIRMRSEIAHFWGSLLVAMALSGCILLAGVIVSDDRLAAAVVAGVGALITVAYFALRAWQHLTPAEGTATRSRSSSSPSCKPRVI